MTGSDPHPKETARALAVETADMAEELATEMADTAEEVESTRAERADEIEGHRIELADAVAMKLGATLRRFIWEVRLLLGIAIALALYAIWLAA
jgi:hypothetical protein